MAENTNYYQVLDLAGVQQLWDACKATFVRTVNGQGIDANGNVQIAGIDALSIYPIGSIYLSVDSTSPASLFGGTWTQIKDTFLLSAGDTYSNGATGGNATHTHGTNNLYAEFALNEASGGELALDAHLIGNVSISLNRSYNIHGLWDNFGPAGRTTQGSATTIGGSLDNANNLPPYLVVYMWKRTA